MSTLTDTLIRLARTPLELNRALYREKGDGAPVLPVIHAGPNNWSEVTDGDFGQFYDFEVLDTTDDRKIVYAASEAALQWCYAHLPEDCPRWRDTGFIVDGDVGRILNHMDRDKLVDRRYAEAKEQEAWG